MKLDRDSVRRKNFLEVQDVLYGERAYRSRVNQKDLIPFRIAYKETDAIIYADRPLEEESFLSIVKYHRQLEGYIRKDPEFVGALEPRAISPDTHPIVQEMADAAYRCGVGPMAAVAGAMAEFVGRELLAFSNQIIIENGGDLFIKTARPRTVAILAESSPWGDRLGIEIFPNKTPMGICTSSGKMGQSFSLGQADAVTMLSTSTALADAMATAVCNLIQGCEDIEEGILFCQSVENMIGGVICIGGVLGAWGDITLVEI